MGLNGLLQGQLYLFYLTTLSAIQNDWMIVNNELEGTWMAEIVAQFNVLARHLL
jgi:hypothetical protein